MSPAQPIRVIGPFDTPLSTLHLVDIRHELKSRPPRARHPSIGLRIDEALNAR